LAKRGQKEPFFKKGKKERKAGQAKSNLPH